IVKLNQEFAESSYRQFKDEYDLRLNKKTQLKLSLERNLIDLRSSYRIKELTIESMAKKVEQEERLYKLGAGSKESLDQAKLNLEISKLELSQLDEKIKNQAASLEADLRELDLNIQIQAKKMAEQKSKLDQSEARSARDGIVTYVNDEIGANVNSGDVIARVADLSSFKIVATISDIYAAKLQIGGPVSVRINELDLDGAINQINPSVENGIVTFSVKLKEKSHESLRSNLRVQVFVITAFKDNVVRVKNGPFYNGTIDQNVFVIDGDQAIRRKVNIGVSNFDYVELLTNIKAGDEVIITDMQEYQHMSEIELTD
ncbi:MAG: efflux RND transporter periplasmic adaptor subunit, partial [Calditrichaeota bacterium]|nr:efflux RND transporter periplasmic adaptor subunit [Calditrichota bacterium]